MKSFCIKVIGAVVAFAILLTLTGCGSVNIIGLAVPAMVEINEGDTEALDVSYSADRDNVSDEALMEAAEKLELEWASSDEAIVTVDDDGVVTAVSNGKTTIMVKSGDISTEVEVTVFTAPAFIEVEDAELTVGKSGELTVNVDADNVTFTNPLSYTSSDEDVCKVNEDGIVSGISEGEATITVANGAGVTGTATITVKPAPVVRPATSGSNSGNSAGNSSGNAGSTGSGSAGSSGGSAAPESTSTTPVQSGCTCAMGRVSTCPIHGTPCSKCGVIGHTPGNCPNVYHYHGNGYDEGVCPGCSTIYTAYLAGPDAFRPEGPGFE